MISIFELSLACLIALITTVLLGLGLYNKSIKTIPSRVGGILLILVLWGFLIPVILRTMEGR